MPTVFITGANRGLGLEFAKQYAAEGWEVIATCRNPNTADQLKSLPLEVRELDVSDPNTIESMKEALRDRAIDVLINNAGVHGKDVEGIFPVESEEWIQAFKINVMAPVYLTYALMDNLAAAEKPIALTMGSQGGILSLYNKGGLYLYRTTKAAAHAAGVCLAHDCKEKGIIYLIVRPGRTKTDMAGSDAPYDVDDTILCLRNVIANASMDQSGKFIDRSGEVLPWLMEKNANPGN